MQISSGAWRFVGTTVKPQVERLTSLTRLLSPENCAWPFALLSNPDGFSQRLAAERSESQIVHPRKSAQDKRQNTFVTLLQAELKEQLTTPDWSK